MTVRRDGYYNGEYPRVGSTIAVDDPELVKTFEIAGFAERQAPEPEPVPARKDRNHAR